MFYIAKGKQFISDMNTIGYQKTVIYTDAYCMKDFLMVFKHNSVIKLTNFIKDKGRKNG